MASSADSFRGALSRRAVTMVAGFSEALAPAAVINRATKAEPMIVLRVAGYLKLGISCSFRLLVQPSSSARLHPRPRLGALRTRSEQQAAVGVRVDASCP